MGKARSANLWPGLVVLLGVSFLVLTGWSVYRSATQVSPEVETGRTIGKP